MYYGLCHHLPGTGMSVHGLVTGSKPIKCSLNGMIEPFAEPTASVWARWRGVRHAAHKKMATSSPDLIAAHFALYAFPILDIAWRYPLVIHFHGPWAAESHRETDNRVRTRLKALLERVVYHQADRVIVLSTAFRDVLCERYGVSPDRIRIVPGGVDADRFDVPLSASEARSKLGWPTDRPVVLCVRRLAKRMGLSALIDAMTNVRRNVPDVVLLIAGKGPLADALDAQIAARGVQDHVRLLGFVPDDDLPLAYRAADCSIVPTEALEGFGLITLESLAAGTPVLVTPVGGLPETVRDLNEDLVLENSSAEALTEGLLRALQNPSSLPDAATCQSYVRAHFDWPVIARQVRDVYEEVA